MKKLLLFGLLIPFLSFGQKFEISEQAGYSITKEHTPWLGWLYSGGENYQKNGFSDQVTISYHLIKHFSIGIFYEVNSWKSTCNSFGFAPDFTTKYLFAGIDLKRANLTPFSFDYQTISYGTPFFSYGAHIGSKQIIAKHFSFIEQIGYQMQSLNVTYDSGGPPQSSLSLPYNETLNYLYFRIGLSYIF